MVIRAAVVGAKLVPSILLALCLLGLHEEASATSFRCRERHIGARPRGVLPPPPVYVDADSLGEAIEKARPSFSGQFSCVPRSGQREDLADTAPRTSKSPLAKCPTQDDVQTLQSSLSSSLQPFAAALASADSKTCAVSLPVEQQMFLAGFLVEADGLCQWDLQQSSSTGTFLRGALAAATGGGGSPLRKSEPVGSHISRDAAQQSAFAAPFSAGAAYAKIAGCKGQSLVLRGGILAYLDRTGKGASGARFLDGCANDRSARLSAEQCSCLAEVVRSVLPPIYYRSFDYKEHVTEIKQRGTSMSGALLLLCGF